MSDRLPDRWSTKDFPVLFDLARRVEGGEQLVYSDDLDHTLDLQSAPILDVLLQSGYVLGQPIDTAEQGVIGFHATGLTERGRRAVGLWPSGEGVDALVTALEQAAEATSDSEEKTLIRRAALAPSGP